MYFPAEESISFLVPSFSKATSSMLSGPMGRTVSTVPFPKALCSTLSPTRRLSSGAAGAGFFTLFIGMGREGARDAGRD